MASDFLNGLPVRPYTTPTKAPGQPPKSAGSAASFADTLTKAQEKAGGLKFSAHAMQRIQQRGIPLQAKDVQKLEQAVEMMAQKGSRDGYVLYGNQGFVVNVPNRTVVTTMTHDSPTVITKVDSVAVVPRLDQ